VPSAGKREGRLIEMKVIGKTEDGYIIDASGDEVANLIGYYGTYSLRDSNRVIYVGDKINISGMYKQLYNLKNNEPKLKEVVKTLRGLADLLEPCCPVIEAQIKEEAKA
jgi:hypothetical protein